MVHEQSVLVVDGIAETAQVLRAVLEPRGVQVRRISHAATRRGTAAQSRPALIVLHMDDTAGDAFPDWEDVPRVLVGTCQIPADTATPVRVVHQPFDYRELIQAVEAALERRCA